MKYLSTVLSAHVTAVTRRMRSPALAQPATPKRHNTTPRASHTGLSPECARPVASARANGPRISVAARVVSA